MNPTDPEDALRRDAAQVPTPAFHAALHQATMQRLQAEQAQEGKQGFCHPQEWSFEERLHRLRPLWAGFSVAVVVVLAVLWEMPWRRPHQPPVPTTAVAALPPATLASYTAVAGRGEAALLALLEQDAATLLLPTPAAFQAIPR